MPRRSAASLAVVPISTRDKPRLAAPADLSPEQRKLWLTTVDSLAADWFDPAQMVLLRRYVEHACRAAQIESALADLDPVRDLDVFLKLSTASSAESAKTLALARAMRLTQQSRLRAETAATKTRSGTSTAWSADALLGVK